MVCSPAPISISSISSRCLKLTQQHQQQRHSKQTLLAYGALSGGADESKQQSTLKAQDVAELPEQHQMDLLLRECFVDAVVKSWQMRPLSENKTRSEGYLHMPIKGTKLYTDFMRPMRPAGTSLDVKMSSYKTLRSFLEQLQNEKLIVLEPGLSDPLVKKIHYDHPDFGFDLPEPLKPKSVLTLRSVGSFRPAWSQDRTPTSSTRSVDSTVDDSSSIRSTSEDGSSLASTSRTSTSCCLSIAVDDASLESHDGTIESEATDKTMKECPISPTPNHQTPSFSGFELANSIPQRSDSIVCRGNESEASADKMSFNSVCQVPEAVSRPNDAGAVHLDSCGWIAGDYLVEEAWNVDMTWGDETSLPVKKREAVYVTTIDEAGWAKATSLSSDSGSSGWLPAFLLKRYVHVASMSSPKYGSGYMVVRVFDRLAVFHRDGKWAYGAKVKKSRTGAADEEQVLEEGWFLLSCTD